MIIENNQQKGRAGISQAIAYFGSNGYTVSVPLNDTQWYDQVVEKDGVFQTVQCKFTDSKDNAISLRSCGGTNGGVYDTVLNHPLDILFCVDSEMNMFLIPMRDQIQAGNKNRVTLRSEPVKNNFKGFETYRYLVKI